jgi:hypothetical protein
VRHIRGHIGSPQPHNAIKIKMQTAQRPTDAQLPIAIINIHNPTSHTLNSNVHCEIYDEIYMFAKLAKATLSSISKKKTKDDQHLYSEDFCMFVFDNLPMNAHCSIEAPQI